MSNPWCFGACVECRIGASSISSASWRGWFFSPLHSLSAFCCFRFCFLAPSAAGGVTSGVGLDGCVGCRDRLSLLQLSLFVFFFFFSPGNWIVSWFGGCVGNWFNGCVSVGHTMVMEVHPYHVRRQVGFSIKLNNCQETDARSTQTTSIQIILQNINNIWRRNMKVARFILDNLCTKKCFL